jgi:hypothetical protein
MICDRFSIGIFFASPCVRHVSAFRASDGDVALVDASASANTG